MSYLQKFQKIQETAPHSFRLFGDRVVLELLPPPEVKSAGGLIMQAVDNHRTTLKENMPQLAQVLQLGPDFYAEGDSSADDEETSGPGPSDIKVGDIVYVSKVGLSYLSTFPGIAEYTGDKLALVRPSEIHAVIDPEALQKIFNA